MTTTTCPKCDGAISSTAKFCRHCRYDLRESDFSLPPRPTPLTQSWVELESEDLSPVVPEASPRRHSRTIMIVGLVVLLFVVFCVLAGLTISRVMQSRSQNPAVESGRADTAQPVIVEMVVPTASSPQGQPVITVPTLPPTSSSSSSLPVSQYDIVVAGGTVHPNGAISYSSSQTCMGGCGSYSGILELQGIRIVDQGFVLDLQIRATEVSGDPWLFGANIGDIIVLEVNGQTFKPTASSFPTQVTSPGLMTGYLSFYESIPVSADGQYKIILTINNRLQPIEGWLSPHK